MGVALPEGAKKVELNFSSDTYKEGKTITLAALAISILAVLAGLFIPSFPGGTSASAAKAAERRSMERAA
jgi:hypothetical protein